MILKQDLGIPPWLIEEVLSIEERDPYERQVVLVGGVRNLGKTTGLIQLIRHLGSKQIPDANGVRTLKFFILRTAYREIDQLVESFDEWFDEVPNYDKVRRAKEHGYSYKNLHKAPKICFCEPTPDLLGLIKGEPYEWDGTLTKVEITCFSYNKPNSDAAMRGTNLGSGMLNEAQTLPVQAFQTARGSYGRPEGKVLYPTILLDHNMPKSEDVGYDWLKKLYKQKQELLEGEKTRIVNLPTPYKFVRDNQGDTIIQGRSGFIVENENFLNEIPHLRNLDSYNGYRLEGEDAILRDMLGKFGLKNSGNLLYPEFDEDEHMTGEIKPPDPKDFPYNKILVVMDFGFQPAVIFAYVQHGVPYIFHEIVIDDINFFDLMTTEVIPYMEKELHYYYTNDQIVIVGDPTSGNRRDAIKSSTPIKVLLGETDINGDEDGDADRYSFGEVVPSPCGNSWVHRMHVSKQLLTKKGGVKVSNTLPFLDKMFNEYLAGPNGTKPKKQAGDLLHAVSDVFQYLCAYVSAGFDTHISEPKKKRKRKKRKAKRVRYR